MRVSFPEFRKVVETIRDPKESYIVKLAYLTAARANELCSVNHDSYLHQRVGKKGQIIGFTRAVGPLRSDVQMDEWKGTPVLLIDMQVLKRKEKSSYVRTVGLPCSDEIEPWVVDIYKRISLMNADEPLVNMDSWHLNAILKQYNFYDLCRIDKGRIPPPFKDDKQRENWEKKIENPLRHFRRMHLKTFYHLDPEERTAYVGAKLSSIRGASASEDEYMALSWIDWMDKLLKPVMVIAE